MCSDREHGFSSPSQHLPVLLVVAAFFEASSHRGNINICFPAPFATIAEDMPYNNGPMISERHFDEFIAPYYCQFVPRLQEMGAAILVDTDGDVTRLVPWLLCEDLHGVFPPDAPGGRGRPGTSPPLPPLVHGGALQ